MNWSKSHLWSVASGWASTMSSMSSLGSAGGVGWGKDGLDVEVKGGFRKVFQLDRDG